jgi:hydroxyacylglutathione hydrolase
LIFQQLLNEESGCLSYLIGCADAGRAVIVDPGRDRVHDYLRIARKKGLTITDVVETHTHADHISGNRDLAGATGATIRIHRAAEAAFDHAPLADGDVVRVGTVELKVCHAPGHTPDSICVLVTDHSRGTDPWFVLTGDTLFVGAVGRPDLPGDAEAAARQLYRSLTGNLLRLPDALEIYPAHFGGSACGTGLSGKPMSTLGFERRFNPLLAVGSEEEFVRAATADLPPKPAEMLEILEQNRNAP